MHQDNDDAETFSENSAVKLAIGPKSPQQAKPLLSAPADRHTNQPKPGLDGSRQVNTRH
jgi:hypothetical protein